MSRLNHEEQFNFLISCIRWSNNGRVDFEKVAEECEIVTKGAAAKRYERMMKAHSIAVNTKAPDEPNEEAVTPKKRRKRAAADIDEADEDIGNKSSKKPKTSKVKKEEAKCNANPGHFEDANIDDAAEDDEVHVKADPIINHEG